MPILPDVVIPDYSESQEPLMWTQMDQLRAKGFFASDMVKLNLTRGEALHLLAALSLRDYRPQKQCIECVKHMAPGRGRFNDPFFVCYHCIVTKVIPLAEDRGLLATNLPPVGMVPA